MAIWIARRLLPIEFMITISSISMPRIPQMASMKWI